MKFKTRYKFWHILVGFIGFGVMAGIIYGIYYSMNYTELNKETEKIAEETVRLRGSSLEAPLGLLYFISFFYFTLNYFYNLFAENKGFLSFLKIIGLIYFVSFIYNSILYYFLPGALHSEYSSLGQMIGATIGGLIPLFIISYIIAYLTISREAFKQRFVLQAQKLQLEAQISQANFNFLKAQINPHFLHNTLNFLYAKSLPYSAELSEGILTLSDIMRYALSQGNQKDGKAPLKDEIEHVHNVIKISQLRFSNQLKVNFEVQGNVNDEMIIPFVLITIVENAFKHGDLKNPDHPIEIKLSVKNNQLNFYCRNRKKSGPTQLSTGIGLDNIKKRLELAYGNSYKFNVKDEPDFYTTELIIDKL